ncbi:hypothetical protein K439DRAFT_1638971 [Ramaria rubella]|nr:hypothetical protein K439DRAFT_1638971 [Ramaria rubella]
MTQNGYTLPRTGFGWERTATAFRLSHVCQRWRRVAQEDALLWTDIDTIDMDPANHCFFLCRDAPIRLLLHDYYYPFRGKPVIRLLRHHLYHIRELHLRLCADYLRCVLRALPPSADWSLVAPKLSAIVVHPTYPDPSVWSLDEFDVSEENMDVLPIFACPPRQLLDITFHHVTPTASSPIWDNRRKLTFLSCCVPPRSGADYLDLIARSPNLTCLTISGLLTFSPFVSCITANHLTNLTIDHWPPQQIKSFLQHLIIPNIKELAINVQAVEHNGPSLNLLPSSQRSLNLFHEIRILTVGSRTYTPEHGQHWPLPRECDTAWTGLCSDLRERFTVIVPFCYEGRLTVVTDTLSLFPNLQILILKKISPGFTWDLGTSHSIRTLRIEGLFRGNQICMEIFKELEKRKYLPCLNRIELVNITFLPGNFGKVLAAIESLLSHSPEPTFGMSSCVFFSQREHDKYLRSRGFETSKWEKFKGMPFSTVRKVWKRQITGN